MTFINISNKKVPTKEAMELAKKYGLTVIGQTKQSQMILYVGKLAEDIAKYLCL